MTSTISRALCCWTWNHVFDPSHCVRYTFAHCLQVINGIQTSAYRGLYNPENIFTSPGVPSTPHQDMWLTAL